jgi:hypothetical protein
MQNRSAGRIETPPLQPISNSREGVISLIEAVKKTIPVPSVVKAG